MKFLNYSILALIIFTLFRCAPTAGGPVALFYHNLTSKYNAYFLARERMKEMEDELYKADKNNYNTFLNIYPKVDCTFSKSKKDFLDKIIKTSSIPIQWHKPSHWLDDCYLLIGKCRYYDYDRDNAITTFRYVNSKYKDDIVKHDALIWLIHTYMDMEDWQSASDWIARLEVQKMIPKNIGKLSLANGHYHIYNREYDKAFEKLSIGAKYTKPRPYRLKIYYILGQLAQKIGNNKEAVKNFDLARRRNPNYEMSFNAILNTYLLKEYKTEEDYNKTYAFYKKSMKDIKNTDFKDKIYYDWGTLEQGRTHLDEAVEKYKLSAANGKKNLFVRSFAFLRIGEIYYDSEKFELAKLYYDSTMLSLDKDLPEYPKAKKRQRILAEFVEQLKIVRKEDSLQKLAKLSPDDLDKLIAKWIKDEDDKAKAEKKAMEKLARIAEQQALNPNADASVKTENNEKWYFYNPNLLALGVIDFSKKWGNRMLEDNWRRQNKEREFTDSPAEEAAQTNEKAKKDSVEKAKTEVKGPTTDQRKKDYLEQIPLDQVKFDTSVAKLKRALFKLGRIYDFNLEEYKNAKRSYGRYYTDFEDDDRAPEALYAVYLICTNKAKNDSCAESVKQRLIQKYPENLYTYLVLDPEYLQKNKIKGEKVKAQYRLAFESYEQGNYLRAQSLVDTTQKYFPKSDFEDRMIVLKAMITGQTQSMENYQNALKLFIKDYPKSKLKAFAEDLLEKAEKLAKADLAGKLSNKITWNLDINFPHYFCIVIKQKTKLDDLKQRFITYNKDFYTDEMLDVQDFSLDSVSSVLAIRTFKNKIQSMNYWEKQNGKSSPLRQFPDMQLEYFVMSEKNYEIMTKAKSWKGYGEFFKKNY
ncbi:MAG: hypothetical protein EAZ53_10755 [Bacteroidetes bacterium]|nr:MAG: hypothetical protein EAZ53_10755 [Bacteroidota bacterium]